MPEIHNFQVGSTAYQLDYEHLANKPEEIPEHDENDSGKVLCVNSTGDALTWGNAPSGLPEVPLDYATNYVLNGKVQAPVVIEKGATRSLESSVEWDEGVTVPVPNQSDSIMFLCSEGAGSASYYSGDLNDDVYWTEPNFNVSEGKAVLTVNRRENSVIKSRSGNSNGSYYLTWEQILPDYDSGDEGKALTVDEYGELQWTEVSGGGSGGGSELPPYDSSDDGKVLAVDSQGELEWIEISEGTELPYYDSSDEGKVLGVDSQGELEWVEISGGGSELPEWTEDDAGKALMLSPGSAIPCWGDVIPPCDREQETVLRTNGSAMVWEPGTPVPLYDENGYDGAACVLVAGGGYGCSPQWVSASLIINHVMSQQE